MKRFIGEIQKRLMIFGLSNNYIYSIFGVLVSIFSMYINIIPDNILGDGNKVELLVISFSTFMIAYKFYVETQELDERNNEFFEVDVCNYKADVRKKVILPYIYRESGYSIQEFNNERFVMSDEVNNLIHSDKFSLNLDYSGKFLLSKEIKLIAPFALNKAFKSRSTIYNSQLIRLADEIYLNRDNKIRVQKTDYFQGLCTNEMVYNKLKSILNIYDPFVFKGEDLLLDENGELIQLCESLCSNYLGGSTVAVTNDNYIIINSQSSRSAANSGRLAPSGSGSTDFRDLKKLVKNKKKSEQTFQELVKITMERELREECGLLHKNVKMKSKVIGFARLLERGGKPDFFGITYIDIKHHKIKESLKEYFEIGNYRIMPIHFNSYKEIPDILFDIIHQDNNKISIQIYIIAVILKYFYDNGDDLFMDLETSSYEG
jgi:hypothetical protein